MNDLSAPKLEFGVNLNNREPLIAPDYSLSDLLALSCTVEERGFDSIWVGDSLFSKPSYEPLTLLAAISQRTTTAQLGTACLLSAMGNAEEGVKREYAALGLDFARRAEIFEEGLEVIRLLWTNGEVTFAGRHFQYTDISFFSGTELAPLGPSPTPPPIWVVSNPRILADGKSEKALATTLTRAARRIARYGDGWLTCCRACYPDEYREQLAEIHSAIRETGGDSSDFATAYQVTMNIADSRDEAWQGLRAYIDAYYPELGQFLDLAEWGPVGTPEDIIDWIRTFADAGVRHFICRFGSTDQFGQVERFARDVLPAFGENHD